MAHNCLYPNLGYRTTDKINKYLKSKEKKTVVVFAISSYLKAFMQMHDLGLDKKIRRNNLHAFAGVSFNDV